MKKLLVITALLMGCGQSPHITAGAMIARHSQVGDRVRVYGTVWLKESQGRLLLGDGTMTASKTVERFLSCEGDFGDVKAGDDLTVEGVYSGESDGGHGPILKSCRVD
jgi:hypothetical protein